MVFETMVIRFLDGYNRKKNKLSIARREKAKILTVKATNHWDSHLVVDNYNCSDN